MPAPERALPPDHSEVISVLLRGAGLAPTRQRHALVLRLLGRERPVTAQELFDQLRADGLGVGLSTVYRALNALAKAGVLHAFDRDGETAYRLCSPTDHHHLVCRRCGLVLERHAGVVERWVEQIRTEEDFTPDFLRTEVHGICGACRRSTHCHHRSDGRHQPGAPRTTPATRDAEEAAE